MITVYCMDGEIRKLNIKPTLEIVQSLVGGLIQMVPGHDNVWCNEEGLMLRLPPNRLAIREYRQNLVGNVVIAELD